MQTSPQKTKNYKLRIKVSDGSKFIIFIDPSSDLETLKSHITSAYEKYYPDRPRIQVTKLADSQKYDILDEFDTSVTVAAMFDDKDVVHVQCKYDTGIHLNQRTSEIQSPIFGINNAE